MGYIGYYIKKDNILSVIILLPMLLLLAATGLVFLNNTLEHFPQHLLSFIACFAMIIVIILGVLNKTKIRAICLVLVIIATIGYIYFKNGIDSEYEVYKNLEEYNLSGNVVVSSFSGTKKGNVEVRHPDKNNILKLNGKYSGKYKFTVKDEKGKEITFEYYYDKNEKTVIVNEIKK